MTLALSVLLAVVAIVAKVAASGLVLLVAIHAASMSALNGHMIEEVVLLTAIKTVLIDIGVAK